MIISVAFVEFESVKMKKEERILSACCPSISDMNAAFARRLARRSFATILLARKEARTESVAVTSPIYPRRVSELMSQYGIPSCWLI